MSEPASLGVKKDPKDVPSKQLHAEGSSFPNLTDDGFPAGPSLKSPTPAEDTAIMSDDDTKTLTTLEPVKKIVGGVAKKSIPAYATKVVQTLSNVPRILPEKKQQNDNVKAQKTPDKELFSNESIIEKMRSKLSKHIERSPLNTAPVSPPLDMSGAIEIPQDLILSNDIPQTPIAAPDTKESKLDDHDLIAILEGNVVAIRENASEIEVCVGGEEVKESGEEMEVLSFSIINPDELEHAKKEREKEIARRQMESLPLLPKVRRPRVKTTARKGVKQPETLTDKWPIEVKEMVPSVVKMPAGVTIKGQTTITPIVKIPLDGGLPIKKEPTVRSEAVQGIINKNLKDKLSKDVTLSTVVVKKAPQTPDVSPESPQKKSQLVDSLVSDWDDEPPTVTPRQDVVDSPMPPVNKLPTVPMHQPPKEGTDGPKQFIAPSPVAEPKRVIKRKIIWDPSDSTIPFASLVKSNRAQSANLNANSTTNLIPLRRKRADSVAVRMIDSTPQFSMVAPVRQRAKTPELGQVIERKVVPPMVVKREELANDLKGKKRKKNEIERLLGDEGAINMLYDVECETNRKDLLKDTEVDTSDEDEKLLAKTKIITDVVIKQSKSPNETTAPQGLRIRTKRSTTPMNQSGSGTTSSPQNSTKASVLPPSMSGAVKKPTNGTTNIPPITGARKRKMTASAAKEWEYVYNAQRNDDAMIIRRRSNSSYSSGASPRRLSFDQTNEAGGTGFGSEKSISPQSSNNSKAFNEQPQEDGFLFAKPPAKSEPQRTVTKLPGATVSDDIKFNPTLVANMRGKLTKVLKGMKGTLLATNTPEHDEPSKGTKQPIKRKTGVPSGCSIDGRMDEDACSSGDIPPGGFHDALQKQLEQLKQMTCVKQDNYAEIVLASKGIANDEGATGLTNVFSHDLMHGLASVLSMLQRDPSVRAVLIRSSGAHFSRGLDVGHLLQPVEKRSEVAENMSACLMKLLRSIISFPKPLVAAVHGDVLGMGVTILPMFDLVVAQMGSSFTAPYGHFGYLPEGMGAFTACRPLKAKTVTDLFLLGKRLTATAALDYGLVTETVPPERFEDRARSVTKTIASQSVQTMQSIKQHLRRDLVTKLETMLLLEKKRHCEQWVTAECQQKFKLFVGKGGEL